MVLCPFCSYPLAKTLTSFPILLYIIIEIFESSFNSYSIVISGLKGLGKDRPILKILGLWYLLFTIFNCSVSKCNSKVTFSSGNSKLNIFSLIVPSPMPLVQAKTPKEIVSPTPIYTAALSIDSLKQSSPKQIELLQPLVKILSDLIVAT